MLPGFRFLFTAIVLSVSILVFGLGAAALLRAAHEEFANHPARRAPPEPVFSRQNFPAMPTLALLRVDPPAAEKPAPADEAAAEIAPDTVSPAEQAPDAALVETGKLAAPASEEAGLAETAVPPPPPVIEAITETVAAPAEPETPAANAATKLAAIIETPEPPPAKDGLSRKDGGAARIATLGGLAVIVDEKTSARTTDASPDRSAVKKRAAQRARERRRAAARRARLAREAALAEQAAQPQRLFDPFTQELGFRNPH